MSDTPSEQVLSWAADAVGTGAKVIAVKSLHGGSSPWLLRIEHNGTTREVVLRIPSYRILPPAIATGAAALRVAEAHGLAAPRLIASDLDGRATGIVATLETIVPGSSVSPATVSAQRLQAAGAAIAKVHQIHLEPRPDLSLKFHSLQGPTLADNHPMERRWATLYRASAESEKSAVVDALCELIGWDADRARDVLTHTHSTPLLQLADDKVTSIPRPQGKTVFVHADLWAGNMMWNGQTDVTLIDWKDAGVGDPGVDLGNLRMAMAIQYGADAAAHVLDGWQRESGQQAMNLAYWDAVAALHTPTILDDSDPSFDDQGHTIDWLTKTQRRNAFLRDALDRLD